MSNLAVRILFDAERRAIGVECWEGEHLYRADPHAAGGEFEVKRYFCSREVILAGGAFNSPQLSMLSGIGPAAHLADKGIECLVDRAGSAPTSRTATRSVSVSEMREDYMIAEKASEVILADGRRG